MIKTMTIGEMKNTHAKKKHRQSFSDQKLYMISPKTKWGIPDSQREKGKSHNLQMFAMNLR